MIANYCKTAVICIKPFFDQYPYEKNNVFTADETYIAKIRYFFTHFSGYSLQGIINDRIPLKKVIYVHRQSMCTSSAK